jgi:hypothetical protein
MSMELDFCNFIQGLLLECKKDGAIFNIILLAIRYKLILTYTIERVEAICISLGRGGMSDNYVNLHNRLNWSSQNTDY